MPASFCILERVCSSKIVSVTVPETKTVLTVKRFFRSRQDFDTAQIATRGNSCQNFSLLALSEVPEKLRRNDPATPSTGQNSHIRFSDLYLAPCLTCAHGRSDAMRTKHLTCQSCTKTQGFQQRWFCQILSIGSRDIHFGHILVLKLWSHYHESFCGVVGMAPDSCPRDRGFDSGC